MSFIYQGRVYQSKTFVSLNIPWKGFLSERMLLRENKLKPVEDASVVAFKFIAWGEGHAPFSTACHLCSPPRSNFFASDIKYFGTFSRNCLINRQCMLCDQSRCLIFIIWNNMLPWYDAFMLWNLIQHKDSVHIDISLNWNVHVTLITHRIDYFLDIVI